jgi:hypothetical protein
LTGVTGSLLGGHGDADRFRLLADGGGGGVYGQPPPLFF